MARTLLLAAHTYSYQRHRPEHTLLYQLVEHHYPEFLEQLSGQGKSLPRHVEQEFEEFLTCGRLEHGFLRVVCDDCKYEKLVAFSCKRRGFCPSCGARRMAESAKLLVDDVLGGYPVRQWVLSLPIPLRLLLARYPKELSKVMQIIHRAISTGIVHKAGFSNQQARTGAVTYIQRFGSALNLNIHFHMLFLEGVITNNRFGKTTFIQTKAPNHGQKVFTLQTVPHSNENEYGQLAKTAGFSLHAGVFTDTHQTDKLERLCRYISRPAISEQRLCMTEGGKVRYELKTPFKDGTKHVFFSPLDFISRHPKDTQSFG